MLRLLPALLLVVAACDDGADPDPTRRSTARTDSTPTERSGEGSSTTGVTGTKVYQRDAEAIAADLKRLEEAERPTEANELEKFQQEVRLRLQHIELTLKALAVSIKAEARNMVQQRYAAQRRKEGEIRVRLDDLHREASEVRRILAQHESGGDLPPGFTVDEMKDRLKDLEAKMAKENEELEEVTAGLEKTVALLESGTVPEQGETVLTKERAVLEALRDRARKLLQ